MPAPYDGSVRRRHNFALDDAALFHADVVIATLPYAATRQGMLSPCHASADVTSPCAAAAAAMLLMLLTPYADAMLPYATLIFAIIDARYAAPC